MIIRLTFQESDYTHHLEDFCENLRDRLFNHETFSDLAKPSVNDFNDENKYFNAMTAYFEKCNAISNKRKYMLSPHKIYEKNTADYKTLCSEIFRLWEIYADEHDMSDFTPDIDICHMIDDQDENGEVVYYFVAFNRYITK